MRSWKSLLPSLFLSARCSNPMRPNRKQLETRFQTHKDSMLTWLAATSYFVNVLCGAGRHTQKREREATSFDIRIISARDRLASKAGVVGKVDRSGTDLARVCQEVQRFLTLAQWKMPWAIQLVFAQKEEKEEGRAEQRGKEAREKEAKSPDKCCHFEAPKTPTESWPAVRASVNYRTTCLILGLVWFPHKCVPSFLFITSPPLQIHQTCPQSSVALTPVMTSLAKKSTHDKMSGHKSRLQFLTFQSDYSTELLLLP